MLLKCSWLLSIFLLSLPGFAVNKVGNGGDVVFCAESITLLDFYEGSIDFTTIGNSPYSIATAQFEKLKNISSETADLYIKRLSEIQNEIEFKKDVELTDVKDSNHLHLPVKDCKLIQIAIRKKKITPNEKRFLIHKGLWEKLNPLNQAGLLSHEIIYEHLIKLGEEDSVKARKLNAFIFGEKVDGKAFWALIKALEIPIYPSAQK